MSEAGGQGKGKGSSQRECDKLGVDGETHFHIKNISCEFIMNNEVTN